MSIILKSLESFSFKVNDSGVKTSVSTSVNGYYVASVDAIVGDTVYAYGSKPVISSSTYESINYSNLNQDNGDKSIYYLTTISLSISGKEPLNVGKLINRSKIDELNIESYTFSNAIDSGKILFLSTIKNIVGDINPSSYGFSKVDNISGSFSGNVFDVEEAISIDGNYIDLSTVSKIKTISSGIPSVLNEFNIPMKRGNKNEVDIDPGIYYRNDNVMDSSFTFEMDIVGETKSKVMQRELSDYDIGKDIQIDSNLTFEMDIIGEVKSKVMQRDDQDYIQYIDNTIDSNLTFEMDIVGETKSEAMQRDDVSFDFYKNTVMDNLLTFEMDIIGAHSESDNMMSISGTMSITEVAEYTEPNNVDNFVYSPNGYMVTNILDGTEVKKFVLDDTTLSVTYSEYTSIPLTCGGSYKYDNISSIQRFLDVPFNDGFTGDFILRRDTSYVSPESPYSGDTTLDLSILIPSTDKLNWATNRITSSLGQSFILHLTRADLTSYIIVVYNQSGLSYSTKTVECTDDFLNAYRGSTASYIDGSYYDSSVIVFAGDSSALKLYSVESIINSLVEYEVVRAFVSNSNCDIIADKRYDMSRGVVGYGNDFLVFSTNANNDNVLVKINIANCYNN